MTLLPVPPKSHTATTPRAGTPGLACSAVSAAAASETCSGPRDHSGTRRSAWRSASDAAADQCAGWVTATVSGGGRPPVAA
ncbi:hypothetical protein C1Y40_05352 [Mycobacterium talmoniae]|uniref:Uncharacterized protein n=1 Tax=Mycobacterium talmoniae TaxID=1858794 RepID=A0A2S8BCV1_9MYCO|nr:hypothetical protein C1Y40_05352 [Mycobacterium talmoniae]